MESVKVSSVEIFKVRMRLHKPFVISLGHMDYAENIFIVVRTNIGITGYGECSPFMTIHGESMESAFKIAQYLARAMLHKNPLEIEQRALEMDRFCYGNSSIKSAFNIALYDITAQFSEMPLYAFLGGANNKKIITDYTISIDSPEIMATEALKIIENGFQIIKVKLGESLERDLERVRLVRSAAGPGIPIRLDANQGWDFDTARAFLEQMEPCNIEFCEEPVPRWEFMLLPRISAASPVPVMADESCCDHHDAKRLADIKACSHFNIKLGKSSGITNALKMARIAETAGIALQVGGFLESRLGFTASAHFSLSSDNIRYYDFDSPLMLEEDPVDGGIIYENNGVINVPVKPGLGASLNEKRLNRYSKMVIK